MQTLGHLETVSFVVPPQLQPCTPLSTKHKSTHSPHYNMGITQDIIHTVIIHFFDEIVLLLLKYAKKCHPRHCTMIKDYFA